MSLFKGGSGGSSSTSSTTSNYNYSNSVTDFLGANKSILNLGAGSSTIYTNSLTNSYTTKNENVADLTGGTGGGGGGVSAQLDAAASVGISGSGSASGGPTSKQGGGFSDSPLTSLGSGGGGGVLGMSPLLIFGVIAGVLGLVFLLRKRKKR